MNTKIQLFAALTMLLFIVSCGDKKESPMAPFANESTVRINLEELGISDIPEEIGELTQVELLSIQAKKEADENPSIEEYETRAITEPFRKIPSSIGKLKNLKKLLLVNLDINEIPDAISDLENLEYINLSFNKLDLNTELPKLKNLKNLKHVRVIGNQYEEAVIAQLISEMPSVKIEYKAAE